MVQYERHRTSSEREGRDDGSVSIDDLVQDAVTDAVCSHSLCGRLLQDFIVEDDILEALKREARTPDTAPSVIEFKTTVEGITGMKHAVTVTERMHRVKMDVT